MFPLKKEKNKRREANTWKIIVGDFAGYFNKGLIYQVNDRPK